MKGLIKIGKDKLNWLPNAFCFVQRMCVSDEVTSNCISENFAKIMLCLRGMPNLADILWKVIPK